MAEPKVKFEKVSSLCSVPGTSNMAYHCHVMFNRTIGCIYKSKDTGHYQFMPDYGQPYEHMKSPKISSLKSMIKDAVAAELVRQHARRMS